MSTSDKRAEQRRKALEAVLEKAFIDMASRGPTPVLEPEQKGVRPTRRGIESPPGRTSRQRPLK